MEVWIVVKSKFIDPNIEDLAEKFDEKNLKNSEIIGVFKDENGAHNLQEEVMPLYDEDGNEMDVSVEIWEVV